MHVRFADSTWFHYSEAQEWNSGPFTYYMPSILRGYSTLTDRTFFCRIVVDKTGKARVESVSSSLREDEQLVRWVVSKWEFEPSIAKDQPQEAKLGVIVVVEKEKVDYSKAKRLLAAKGPARFVIVERSPSDKYWAVH
jgi:hypothetical protein